MLSKTEFALGAAIVLSTAVAALAAPAHHRVTHVRAPQLYAVPDYRDSAAPINSGSCQPVGPPCRTSPDGW